MRYARARPPVATNRASGDAGMSPPARIRYDHLLPNPLFSQPKKRQSGPSFDGKNGKCLGAWMGGRKEGSTDGGMSRRMETEPGAPTRAGPPPAHGHSGPSLFFKHALAAATHRERKQHDGQ